MARKDFGSLVSMGMSSHELWVGSVPEVERGFPGEGYVGRFLNQPLSRELKVLIGPLRHFPLSAALAKQLVVHGSRSVT